MNIGKGWRTYLIGALVVLSGVLAALQDPAVMSTIPPRAYALVWALLGGLMIVLRTVTTTPPGESGK